MYLIVLGIGVCGWAGGSQLFAYSWASLLTVHCEAHGDTFENITKIIRPEYFCVILGGGYGKIA